MKSIFTLFTASLLVAALSAGAQHYVPLEPLNKNAILEEFTGVNCPNCPAGHQVMAQILAANPEHAFCVAYHPFNSSYTTPTTGDPDFRRHYADSLYMTPYCGTSRFMPSAFIQRRLWTPPERLTSRTDWTAHTNTILAEPSPMNVGMATSYDEAASLLTVIVDIYYTADFTGEHNLMVTLAENDLVSHQSGGTYPYVHKHTFREAFVGQWGDPILTDATAGTFYTRTFTFDYSATDYIIENCELLAFVVDNTTDEVITGVGCHAGDTTYITPDVVCSADTLFYENAQQCLDGQVVTISNNTAVDLDLLYVQQESTSFVPFPWIVDPWPFSGFPYTLTPGGSVDLRVVLPLTVDGRMDFLYDDLVIVSEVDTQIVVIAANEAIYSGIGHPSGTSGDIRVTGFPNPFTTTTTITLSLPGATHLTAEVYNLTGELVQTLFNGDMPAGSNQLVWDGTSASGKPLPGGVYLYRITTPESTLTHRTVLIR